MGVEQDGRDTRCGRTPGDHGRGSRHPLDLGTQDLDLAQTCPAQQPRHGLGTGLQRPGVESWGGHARDPDQGLQIGAEPGHQVMHPGTHARDVDRNRVGDRGAGHLPNLAVTAARVVTARVVTARPNAVADGNDMRDRERIT